ncbi:conserved hypothetical protein [Beutenbergia cavernae DSM 12333]|uniref:DUF2867 domain-containing protein n=1 Tax=Beutenbergia cavernae (strain ATCC BAA-8 / DSM 12333 / CCUG 43141 / JCM 11478 / NBRC 16432 / NCIMB 13614 / HKI 0122) TaxID=471853 RepID=C5C2N7_BEUC1|nr:hypothetical protein [Beutenbergia cavernae]ACQ79723.1 conserved hypothetical protein [Beutenbergia cavernae DSM 12333]
MSLADRIMPVAEFAEQHAAVIDAPRDAVWDAVTEFRFGDLRLAAPLFAARAAIGIVANGRRYRSPSPSMFVELAEYPGRERVLGLLGRWWRFGGADARADVRDLDAFSEFCEPGYGKAILVFRLEDAGSGRTRVVTQTRVVTTDAAAHRAMARYWALIRPGSGFIRHLMLRAVGRRARATAAAV